MFQVGDSWITDRCTQKCSCSLGGLLTCSAFECNENSICDLDSNGDRYCKPESEFKNLILCLILVYLYMCAWIMN